MLKSVEKTKNEKLSNLFYRNVYSILKIDSNQIEGAREEPFINGLRK
jgi:hypothetical protein